MSETKGSVMKLSMQRFLLIGFSCLFFLMGCQIVKKVQTETEKGEWIEAESQINSESRKYFTYRPKGWNQDKKWPLLVMLHGCLQDARSFASGTEMNFLADQKGFVVLYPQQEKSHNAIQCWNWYSVENQKRGVGEPALIAKAINQVVNDHNVDSNQIFISGISAGGAMAGIISVCYPELIHSAAIHASLPYRSAISLEEGALAMKHGRTRNLDLMAKEAFQCGGRENLKNKKSFSVMVWHGANDKVVHPNHASHLIQFYKKYNDYLDDGKLNSSLDFSKNQESHVKVDGLQYQKTIFSNQKTELVEFLVYAMGHSWSGGNGQFQFNEPRGLKASEVMWDFFKK